MKTLRPKELELMSLFWNTSKPLTSAEVRALATAYSWGGSSCNVMINRLKNLGFLEVAGSFQKRHFICNTYQATISKDKYFGEFISESIGQVNPALIIHFLSNLKESGNLSQNAIEEIQKALEAWRN